MIILKNCIENASTACNNQATAMRQRCKVWSVIIEVRIESERKTANSKFLCGSLSFSCNHLPNASTNALYIYKFFELFESLLSHGHVQQNLDISLADFIKLKSTHMFVHYRDHVIRLCKSVFLELLLTVLIEQNWHLQEATQGWRKYSRKIPWNNLFWYCKM